MARKSKTPKPRAARAAPLARTAADNLADIRAAKQEWSKRLLARPSLPASRALTAAITPDPELNLVGVGIGEKLVDGRRTGVMSLKLLVRAKYHEKHMSEKHVLPKSIDGIPVDVEEVGLFFACAVPSASDINPRAPMRPAQPGCSIGFNDPQGPMAGTFGALVQDDGGGLYILSNNHVLAYEGRLLPGAPIYQPGLRDDATAGQIAQLTSFVGIQPGVLNNLDCAVAAVLDSADVSNSILQIGPPQGYGAAQANMIVKKFGRATGYTVGQVVDIDTTMTVQYENGSYAFGGQIMVRGLDGQPFSKPGDSGSLIVESNTNVAVGLLIAGSLSNGLSLANHISDVLAQFNVTLA